MKTIKLIGFYLLFALFSMLVACNDQFDLVPDPKEVVDIPGFNGDGFIQPYDINDNNEIVGYYGDAYPLGVSDFYRDQFAVGFIIKSDGSNFVELRQENQQNNWPFAINNNGTIVGAYMPFGDYDGTWTPTLAYQSLKDGSDFKSLHPKGYFYSQATHVTESGIVLGEYGRDALTSVACIFQGDTILNLVDTTRVSFSKIACVNNEIAVIFGLEQDIPTYYKYVFGSGMQSKLAISPTIADFSDLHDINEDGLAVGFYVDINRDERAIGLQYSTQTDELTTYQQDHRQQGSTYVEYNFMGINNEGVMVGRTGRDYNRLLQQRAMAMMSDFSGFRDITPENSNIYSEMVAINNQSIALGLIGLPRRNLAVFNKLFVVDLRE